MRAKVRERVEAAAFAVLAARGYHGATMLAVAQAAGASNATLYRGYGDKAGLFAALAARLAEELAAAVEGPLEPALVQVLRLLVSERAVAVQRAAAADASGRLGVVLEASGWAVAMARLRARAGGQGELLLRLVLGDWPLRRVMGMAEPSGAEVERRVAEALDLWLLTRQVAG